MKREMNFIKDGDENLLLIKSRLLGNKKKTSKRKICATRKYSFQGEYSHDRIRNIYGKPRDEENIQAQEF